MISDKKHPSSIIIALPEWIGRYVSLAEKTTFRDEQQAMLFAILLSRENVKQQTGGPFAALVIDRDTGELISLGVNLVTSSNKSSAHAEVVALSLAQERISNWDLSSRSSAMLVTTCEPCVMCYGALQWSGISRLVIGAKSEDAEKIGFNEGVKPENWPALLTARNIGVSIDVHRDEAVEVLSEYALNSGMIYGHR